MAASEPDHLTANGHIGAADDATPPAPEASDASLEEASPSPPPVPVFTEAQAVELVEHPTTDSLKVSWIEVVQTGIVGYVPEGVTLPPCAMNYDLALREAWPHLLSTLHMSSTGHLRWITCGVQTEQYADGRALCLTAHCNARAHQMSDQVSMKAEQCGSLRAAEAELAANVTKIGPQSEKRLCAHAQIQTDPHNGQAPAADGEWISVYTGHQSAAQVGFPRGVDCSCASMLGQAL